MTYRIEAIDRLNNSVNGNPRFRFAFTDLSEDRPIFLATSQSDSAFCYAVGNPGYRVGSEVDVQFSRAGRVTHMTVADQVKLCSCPRSGCEAHTTRSLT